jgi:hypothetical protein
MPLGIGQGSAYTGYGSQSPWFNQNSNYGSLYNFSWPETLGGSNYFNQQNPRAAYTAFTSGFGGGYDPFSQFVQNAYGDVSGGYEAALGVNPALRWTDYLDALGPGYFQQQFQNLTPSQRGRNDTRFVPPARWLLG